MSKFSNNYQQDYKRNRPQKLPAILNTILSSIVIIIIILLKIFTDHVSWYLFFAFLIVLILFPIASWYNFYFSRIQKTKILKNYETEDQLITEYVNHLSKYETFNKDKGRNIEFKIEDLLDDLPKYEYNLEKSSFGFPDSKMAIVSIGIGFTSLLIDPNNNMVVGLTGLAARSIFVNKRLKFNKEQYLNKKRIYITPINFSFKEKINYQAMPYADTYYDKKSGMICIGERKIYDIDDVYQFMDGAYLVLRDGKLVSLWIQIDKGISLY